MSITDELRSWADGDALRAGMSLRTARDQVLAIANRIDAVHESACAEAYGNGVQSVGLPDMTAYVKLPVDADGVPIHIGDVMDNIVCPSVHREVIGVGVECFYGWDDGNGRYSQFDANCYCHHHASTVEDVLRGVVTLCRNTWKEGSAFESYDVDDVMMSGNIAEYAAKLRLAGDAE